MKGKRQERGEGKQREGESGEEIGTAQTKERPSGENNLEKYCRKTQRQRKKEMKEGKRKGERVTDPNPRQFVTRQKWGIHKKKERCPTDSQRLTFK